MRTLTIEELKALEVGDWVWIEYGGKGYFQIGEKQIKNALHVWQQGIASIFDFDTYRTKWIAYKNKEQSEAKGEIVEMPCLRRTSQTYPLYEIAYVGQYGAILIERYEDKFEAERRLAELKGEKA